MKSPCRLRGYIEEPPFSAPSSLLSRLRDDANTLESDRDAHRWFQHHSLAYQRPSGYDRPLDEGGVGKIDRSTFRRAIHTLWSVVRASHGLNRRPITAGTSWRLPIPAGPIRSPPEDDLHGLTERGESTFLISASIFSREPGQEGPSVRGPSGGSARRPTDRIRGLVQVLDQTIPAHVG
jgi:hypothetical protein